MKRMTSLLLPILILSIAHHMTAAQSIGPHTIKGTVYVRGERPPHIEVVLENGTRMPLSRTVADQDGRYTFGGIGFGTYRVVVQPLGEYRGAAQEVEISGSPDSVIIKTVDLSLEPKKGGATTAGTASAFTQAVPKPAEDEYKLGVKAFESGSAEAGVTHLRRAVELFPDYYLALSRLGTEHARAGQYEKAVPLLRRACKVNPTSAGAQIMLGISLVELGQYKEALPALTQGKSLAPKSVNAHLYLGIAQFESGDLTSAEASLRRAYDLGGPARAAVANLHLASVHDRQGKPALAADALEAYLRDVPNAKNAAAIRQVIERLRRKAKG